jgi:hypothetical protein
MGGVSQHNPNGTDETRFMPFYDLDLSVGVF